MRCAAHTLQLAVWDFIKARNIQAIIVKARWLVRKLRTPTLRYMLKGRELPAPLIDVVTRWSSTTVMLEHLVKLENTVKELVEKKFIESKGIHPTFCNSLKELSSLLEPAKIPTTKLQSANLTAGEFHHIWTKMKLNIQNQGTVPSGIFVKCVEEREKKILSSEVLVMSIYADPRYKSILSPEQVRLARENVKELADRLLKLNTAQTVQPTSFDAIVQIDNDEDCVYESILAGGEERHSV
ncbi:unnamed protein product [Allacma fusca]|uniref:Transposase n=1 Tax=Allacma fusca TaxID=39272 RepID=A0A8J2JKR0_9HEXA|nr:unnamed protein product [Allacma fusca]